MNQFLQLEKTLQEKGYKNIVGIDEVGRGPAAGPMVFCGFIYDSRLTEVEGLNDSKKLTAGKRERIFRKLVAADFKFGIGVIWPAEIDQYGLSHCSKLAIERACKSFAEEPDYFLMDGNLKVPDRYLFKDHESLVKGDQKSVCIAAASIIAKVFRDGMMDLYSLNSAFSYDRHKAYLTKLHKDEIKEYGLERIHRKSYNIKI